MDKLLNNLPAIIVALPLLVAPINAFMGGKSETTRWFSWLLSFAVCGVILILVTHIFVNVERYGSESYYFGNWPPPIGIEYQITSFNALMLLLVSAIAFIVMPFALHSVEKEIPKEKTPLFYSCFLLCISGLLGMIMSNDLFNIFVFLEISSLTTYAMVAMGKSNHSLTAAFHYLIVGTTGATFYLTGVALLYMMTGSLNLNDVAQIMANQETTRPILAGFAMMVIGIGIKAGIVPLASWLVRSYTYAPSIVSAFVAGTATKVALYILIRILFSLFGYELVFEEIGLSPVLIAIALTAMLYGSISAIRQDDVKRMLAFSSIANVGYIVLGVATLGKIGLAAAIFHMVSHSIAKTGIFLTVGVVAYKTGGNKLEHFKNLGRKSPIVMGSFIIFGLSLIGIPLTSGFAGKWYLITAAFSGENMYLAFFMLAVIVTSSVLSLVYIWKVVEQGYNGDEDVKRQAVPSHMTTPIITLAALTIILGVYASPLLEYAENIAGGLIP